MHLPAAEEIEAAVVVDQALRSLAFPIAKVEAIRRVGAVSIPLPDEESILLGDLLSGLPGDKLPDPRTTAKAVDRKWDRVARSLQAVEQAHQAAARRP